MKHKKQIAQPGFHNDHCPADTPNKREYAYRLMDKRNTYSKKPVITGVCGKSWPLKISMRRDNVHVV